MGRRARGVARWAAVIALALWCASARGPGARAASMDERERRGTAAARGELVAGIYPGDRFGKRVALTFDDGPHPRFTPAILDLLAAEDLKATFFVVGRAARARPEIIVRIQAEGHTLGNHSWSHPWLGRLSAAEIDRQLADTKAAVDEALGLSASGSGLLAAPEMRFARPPYGDPFLGGSRAAQERVAAAFQRGGYLNILWTVDSRDWTHRGDPGAVVDAVRRGLGAGRGGPLLMHDTHAQTVAALPGLLRLLRDGGHEIVPLEALLADKYGPGS